MAEDVGSECKRRVLGIDPGTATTGYGIVEEDGNQLRAIASGVIRTSADQPTTARLQTIHRRLQELAHEWKPAEAAVEELFFSRNVQTAMHVGQARGVAILALADAGLEVAEYTPLAIKQAVTGYLWACVSGRCIFGAGRLSNI